MLPFMQPKKMASLMVNLRKPDGSGEMEQADDGTNHALLSAAEDLISAVHAKDATMVASALEAAFDICGSYEEPSEGSEGVGDVGE